MTDESIDFDDDSPRAMLSNITEDMAKAVARYELFCRTMWPVFGGVEYLDALGARWVYRALPLMERCYVAHCGDRLALVPHS